MKKYRKSIAERNDRYKAAIKLMNQYDVPLGAARCKLKHGYWPTMYGHKGDQQICSYQPNLGVTHYCQFPCNGDC